MPRLAKFDDNTNLVFAYLLFLVSKLYIILIWVFFSDMSCIGLSRMNICMRIMMVNPFSFESMCLRCLSYRQPNQIVQLIIKNIT